MSTQPSTQKRSLSTFKLIVGDFAAPLMTYLFYTTGQSVGCAGIMALITVVFWIVTVVRVMAFFRFMGTMTQRGHGYQSILTPPSQPGDDSHSVFL